MLGRKLKEFTDQFGKQSGGLAVRDGKLYVPSKEKIQKLSQEQQMEILLQQADAIEAAVKQNIQENQLQALNAPNICDVIENECWTDGERFNIPRHGTPDMSFMRRPVLASHQKRILNHIFQFNPIKGRWKYLTVGYSAPKKSGKTAISGYVGYYFNKYIFTPNRVVLVANDREQAHERAYKAMLPSIYEQGAEILESKHRATYSNGSRVESITTKAESEAGGHYILSIWTELWGFYLPEKIKLWGEMQPINTQRGSMRWWDSYMGYEDKSPLLVKLYSYFFQDFQEIKLHPNARPVPELEDIRTTNARGESIPACYERPDLEMFLYLDHEYRMPWQQDKTFFKATSVGMSEADIMRTLHNRWQKTENKFIKDTDVIKRSFDRGKGMPIKNKRMCLAVDAAFGENDAKLALVGGYDAQKDGKTIYRTNYWKSWSGTKGDPIDLNETVVKEILRLYKAGLILTRKPTTDEKPWVEQGCKPIEVYFDPWELRQIRNDLRNKHKLLVVLFDQKSKRAEADTALQKYYLADRIDNYAKQDTLTDDELYEHISSASAIAQSDKDDDKRIRIGKSGNTPNDLLVAQSMEVYGLSNRPPEEKTFASMAMGKVKEKKGW